MYVCMYVNKIINFMGSKYVIVQLATIIDYFAGQNGTVRPGYVGYAVQF